MLSMSEGVIRVRVAHQSRRGLYKRTNQIACKDWFSLAHKHDISITNGNTRDISISTSRKIRRTNPLICLMLFSLAHNHKRKSISVNTRKTNVFVFLALMLMRKWEQYIINSQFRSCCTSQSKKLNWCSYHKKKITLARKACLCLLRLATFYWYLLKEKCDFLKVQWRNYKRRCLIQKNIGVQLFVCQFRFFVRILAWLLIY